MSARTLVERDELLDELTLALADAAHGGGRLVLLSGPAGIGKTALTQALAARAARGVRRLTGYCDALSTPQVLGPLLDMCGQSPALARAADGPRHALFAALVDELTRAQTLAVIEDVHWADAATADLLVHLGRRVAGTRSLVVVTCREEELRSEHPVRLALEAMATERAIMRRALQPLSVAGVAELAAGRQIDVPQLHGRTGGNPFFVTEVLAAPGWAVPPTVADAVRSRARRLDPGARSVLDTMAVEPGAVRLDHLLALDHGSDAIDAAVASGMVVHIEGRLSFRHELARLAVLGDLPPAARLERHRAWLALLAPIVERGSARAGGPTAPGGEAARVAAHAQGAGDDDATVRWSRRAAEHAGSHRTHREAVAHLEAALAAGRRLDARERAELLRALGRELALVDRRAHAVQAFEHALQLQRTLGDPAATAAVQADVARATWALGDGIEARRLMAEAVADAARLSRRDAARHVAHVHAWAGYLAMLTRDHSGAQRLAGEAERLAREHGFDDILIVALNALGSTRIVGARDLDGIGQLEESRRLAALHGREGDEADALVNLGSALGEIRELELAARFLDEGISFAAARDLDAAGRYITAWLARVRLEQGRWAEAESLTAGTGDDDGRSPASRIVGLTALGLLHARRGEPAHEELDEAWRLAERTADLQRLWPVAAARAELAWLTGTGADAVAPDLARVTALARALGVTGAQEELDHWAARLSGTAPSSGGSTAFARTGVAAVEAWRRLGAPYEEAWALAELGDEPSLREALAKLQRLGAAPLAARVRARLRARGARAVPLGPRHATATHPSGLTDRQVAVLELVGAGLTDRQIGERLFLSTKTVGHHVSAILVALGVDGRAGAAALAGERGWLAKQGNPPQVRERAAP